MGLGSSTRATGCIPDVCNVSFEADEWAVTQQATDAHTLPSTETADVLVQAEVADLSSGSHLLRHSPRC